MKKLSYGHNRKKQLFNPRDTAERIILNEYLDTPERPLYTPTATKAYMSNITRRPLLTQEEEIEYAKEMRNGATWEVKEFARHKLIEANLRLVVKIAHEFRNENVPLRELVSAGNIGLIHAVEKFNPDYGVRFSSYAVWWIKQAIRRTLQSHEKPIRIPISSNAKIKKIKKAEFELREKLGRPPSNQEIADFLGYKHETVVALREQINIHFTSLSEYIYDGEKTQYEDIIVDVKAEMPDKKIHDMDTISRIEQILNQLSPMEKQILVLRFGLKDHDPHSLREIAEITGKTRERVRQIQNAALAKIKKLLKNRLSEYKESLSSD